MPPRDNMPLTAGIYSYNSQKFFIPTISQNRVGVTAAVENSADRNNPILRVEYTNDTISTKPSYFSFVNCKSKCP